MNEYICLLGADSPMGVFRGLFMGARDRPVVRFQERDGAFLPLEDVCKDQTSDVLGIWHKRTAVFLDYTLALSGDESAWRRIRTMEKALLILNDAMIREERRKSA